MDAPAEGPLRTGRRHEGALSPPAVEVIDALNKQYSHVSLMCVYIYYTLSVETKLVHDAGGCQRSGRPLHEDGFEDRGSTSRASRTMSDELSALRRGFTYLDNLASPEVWSKRSSENFLNEGMNLAWRTEHRVNRDHKEMGDMIQGRRFRWS